MASVEGYRFRGTSAEGRGDSLEEAIDDLGMFWDSRPSLVTHNWGVLTLQVTIGSTQVSFQVTDPQILDDLEAGNMSGLVSMMSEEMELSETDTQLLLGQATDVVATVDRIRPPTDPNAWQADPGTDPSSVLPDAALQWSSDVGQELDRQARRDRRRMRSKEGRQILQLVVRSGKNQGLSVTQISRRTGLPRSTVYDASMRIDRESRVVSEFKARKPGQRLTPDQKAIVMQKLQDTSDNATETARQLGLPPRTVRDLRARARRAAAPTTTSQTVTRRTYTQADRDRLMQMVDSGITPSEAARSLGVPPRTGRGWARKEKMRRETEDD